MRTVSPARYCCSAAEPLEARIAPASLSFIDVDGDNVTITTNKGTDAQLETAAHFAEVSPGRFQLQELKLSEVAAFRGANLTIEATANSGDGFVNVGYINATGADLGRVRLDGDLGRIDTGDSSSASRAIALLEVKSLGLLNLATQAAGGLLLSNIKGDAGALIVHGDVREAQLEISGNLARCEIEGSVIGGAAEMSGSIRTGDVCKNMTVTGLIQGGSGFSSGKISGSKLLDVTIGAGIIGGGGENSGQLAARHQLGKITIDGDIIGGGGLESGGLATAGTASQITINGDIRGGSGTQSGQVGSSGNITQFALNGSLLGGNGVQSGSIGTDKGITAVHITGNIVGGTGASSGQIVSKAIIHGLKVDGSLIGGANFESGAIGSLKGVDDISIGTDIVAGTGERSGLIVCDVLPLATIGSVKVLGSIKGTPIAGVAGPGSGGILSGHVIGLVEVGADVLGGNGTDAGSIRAQDGLGKVIIHGSLIGGIGMQSGTVASQKLGNVEIGKDLVGGTGVGSGQISAGANVAEERADSRRPVAADSSDGEIANIFVGGSVFGFAGDAGSGAFNGGILSAGNIGAIVVTGDIIGGDEFGTGAIVAGGNIKSVTVTGTLAGGAGDDSGVIRAGRQLGPVQINKDLRGGEGTNAGAIISGGDIGPVKITEDLTGADGDESGRIYSGGKIKSVTIGGDVTGGDGDYDTGSLEDGADEDTPLGQIVSVGAMGAVKIGGDLLGGDGTGSANVQGASISSIVVEGSIIGGFGEDSGAIIAARTDLPFVKIVGEVLAGAGERSGHIGAARNIGSLEIGALRGFNGDGFRNPALISAGGTLEPGSEAHAVAIKKLVINDATVFAMILAGYDIDADPLNPDAGIGAVTIGVGDGDGTWEATDLVAGVMSGPDFRFGTADDTPISGSPDLSGIVSRVDRLVITGEIILSPGQLLTQHGIVAEQIVNMKLAGVNVPLTGGARNDSIDVGSSGDTTVLEVRGGAI